jgi:hypothetical protein
VARTFELVFLPHMLHSRPFNVLIGGLSFFEQSTLPQGLRHVLVNMTRMLLNPRVKFSLVSSEKCRNAIMAARRLISSRGMRRLVSADLELAALGLHDRSPFVNPVMRTCHITRRGLPLGNVHYVEIRPAYTYGHGWRRNPVGALVGLGDPARDCPQRAAR